ncbi:MAG: fasciclin domain-containing protein [Chloroflexota bacterium]
MTASRTSAQQTPAPSPRTMQSPTSTPFTAAPQQQAPSQNVVQVAQADPRFSTLVRAVQVAGLVDTLSGPGTFTVLAPTNDAFNKLPAGTLDTLLANPAQLRTVLTYHVVQGQMTAGDLPNRPTATSVQGGELTLRTNPARINDANVVLADIQASNGVIHGIDSVLLPPGVQIGGQADAPRGSRPGAQTSSQTGSDTSGVQGAGGRSAGFGPIAAATGLGVPGLLFGAGGYALPRRNRR